MKIIECVPNFSESNSGKIEQIVQKINENAKVLNVETDKDHNRTVITFVGKPKQVLKAGYKAIEKAAELIDMTKHKGQHPRIGATDVFPFIPIQNTSMKDCIKLANKLGKKVGKKLRIPIFLYGEAAKHEERVSLPNIRKGEYEGLEEKLKQKEWKPDYGPAKFNKKSGATVIGARKILIAYNINLAKPDLDTAKKIASTIRTSGIQGKKGCFEALQAKGILLENHNIAQVTMNLLDYETTGIADVYQKVEELAHNLDNDISASEIIGLIPRKALIKAGNKLFPEERSEKELVYKSIKRFKLNDFTPFKAEEKIIEYLI